MLQYAGPDERTSSFSTDDTYRVEAGSLPLPTASVPRLQRFSTAESHARHFPYRVSTTLMAMPPQDSYDPVEAEPSSVAASQASYGQREAVPSSTSTPHISYSPYEAAPSWASTSHASYSRTEAEQIRLNPSTVNEGDIDRPAHNRPRRTRRAWSPTVYTRQWFCCGCNSGPYISSLYASCALGCGHVKCDWCEQEYIQTHDSEAPA